MSRAKYYISSKELLLLYNTLVLPHINYCAFIWGSNYSTRVYKIVRLQKRALRIIDKKPYLYPSNELFIKYKIVKLPDLTQEQCIIILLGFLKKTLPSAISDLFKLNVPSSSRQQTHFQIPFTFVNYRLFSMSFVAPKAWNNAVGKLFKHVQDVPLSKFVLKKNIRNFYIDKYRQH